MSRNLRLTLAASSFLALLLLGVGWGALRGRAPSFHGTSYEPVAAAPDFALVDQNGRAFTRRSLAGAPALLFFGYTRCPDVCPVTLQRLRRAAGGRPEVRIVLVSVDPMHDTPAELARYVRRFGGRVTGLTGDSAAVAAAMRAYGAYTMTPMPHGAHRPASAALAHSAVVYGLDRAGNLQVVISEAARDDELRDDVETLADL